MAFLILQSFCFLWEFSTDITGKNKTNQKRTCSKKYFGFVGEISWLKWVNKGNLPAELLYFLCVCTSAHACVCIFTGTVLIFTEYFTMFKSIICKGLSTVGNDTCIFNSCAALRIIHLSDATPLSWSAGSVNTEKVHPMRTENPWVISLYVLIHLPHARSVTSGRALD